MCTIDVIYFFINWTKLLFAKQTRYTVKSGTNFGMDYSVYRVTPSCSHSEFCVRVTTGDAEGNDWRSISTITRVMPVSLLLMM